VHFATGHQPPVGSTGRPGNYPIGAPGRTPSQSTSAPASASASDSASALASPDLVKACRNYLRALANGHTPPPNDHMYDALRAAIPADHLQSYCQALLASASPSVPPTSSTSPTPHPTGRPSGHPSGQPSAHAGNRPSPTEAHTAHSH
jgi:hypothetical protein